MLECVKIMSTFFIRGNYFGTGYLGIHFIWVTFPFGVIFHLGDFSFGVTGDFTIWVTLYNTEC